MNFRTLRSRPVSIIGTDMCCSTYPLACYSDSVKKHEDHWGLLVSEAGYFVTSVTLASL
jgi:hypothetical protein